MVNVWRLCFKPQQAFPVFIEAMVAPKYKQVIIKTQKLVFESVQKQLMQQVVPPNSSAKTIR